MAKCRICNADIDEGSMYCKDCLEKEQLKSKESYLDSLLSSVIESAQPNKPNIKEQKNIAMKKQKNTTMKKQKNTAIEEQRNIAMEEQKNTAMEEQKNTAMEEQKSTDMDERKTIDRMEQKNTAIDERNMEQSEDSIVDEYLQAFNSDASDDLHDFEQFNIMDDLENADDFMNFAGQKDSGDKIAIQDKDLFGDLKDAEEPDSNIIPNEIDNFSEDDPEDPTLYDLLNELDQSNSDKKEENGFEAAADHPEQDKIPMPGEEEMDSLNQRTDDQNFIDSDSGTNDQNFIDSNQGTSEKKPMNSNPETDASGDSEETIDDEILSLLNQMSVDDPVALEISNLLNETNDAMQSVDDTVPSDVNDTAPSDVGEVFSDALTAVSSLKDQDSDAAQSSIENKMDENKKVKKKKSKKLLVQPEAMQDSKAKEPEKKKDGLFARIFDKNPDKKIKKVKKVRKEKKAKEIEKEIAPGTEDKEETSMAGNPVKRKTAAGKVPKKAVKKSAKKAKKKTKTPLANQEEREESESFGKKAVAAKANKNEKEGTKQRTESLKQKRASKKKAKEVKKAVNEVEVDHGHINPVAASFVMVTFTLLTVLLLSGTKAFAYSNGIKNATYYFNTHKYTQAYDEVYGMDMKDEDVEIYNKIQTVMYVNKQLNSYNNFCAVEKYPEALDSLLKGLKRYDKYIELATMYGIESDMNYVRDQILAELKNKFNLSEEEAMQITFIENETEYSKQVYDIIAENGNN